MNKLISTLVIIALSASLLNGCGWRLRGSLALPADLGAVHVSTRDTHGELITELTRLLRSSDIDIADSAAAGRYSIAVEQERNQRRTVSVGSNALAAEYELTLEADYRIVDNRAAGEPQVPATARVVRSFNFNVNDVTGAAAEERVIRAEMRRELAQKIIRRLIFVSQSGPETAPADKRAADQQVKNRGESGHGKTAV